MSSEIIKKLLQQQLKQKVIIFLKNGNLKFKGAVVEVDEGAVLLDDERAGKIALALESIAQVTPTWESFIRGGSKK